MVSRGAFVDIGGGRKTRWERGRDGQLFGSTTETLCGLVTAL